MTTETEMMELMREAMYGCEDETDFEDKGTFKENGVMTYNTGFMVKATDGSEFQVTVQQNK